MARPKARARRRTWGSVRRLPSGRYQARYTNGIENMGHRAPVTFSTTMDAEAWLNAERVLIERGEWTPPADRYREAQQQSERDQLTVGRWLDRWLDSRAVTLRASTLATYRAEVKRRITEVDGPAAQIRDIPLSQLTREHVGVWWDSITAAFPTTAQRNRHAYVRLRSALDVAVERDLIAVNPVYVRAARRKPSTKDKALPSDADLFAIVGETPQRYRVAVVLCVFHGLRVGECLALRRSDVQIIRDQNGAVTAVSVKVRKNVQRVVGDDGKARMVEQETKTGAGRRTVPVLADFARQIAEHAEKLPEPGSLLTSTRTGAIVLDTSFRSIFNRARDRAEVDGSITPHYGRNWLITRLLEQGAAPQEVGAILGQVDLRTILETYAKVRENRPGDLMAAVSGTIG